jgi:hypothetical protein
MPFTADTGGIIKSLENVDGGRVGDGSGQRDPRPDDDLVYVNRQPVKIGFTDPDTNFVGEGSGDASTLTLGSPSVPSIAFGERPSPDGFGVFVGPNNSQEGGYVVYRVDGGAVIALGTPILPYPGANAFFMSLPSRVYGRGYFARARDVSGKLTEVVTPVIYDNFNEGVLAPDGVRWDFGRNGDLSDFGLAGDGSAQREPREDDFVYVNRAPVKFSTQDPDTNLLGDGAGGAGGRGNADGVGTWTQAGTTRII